MNRASNIPNRLRIPAGRADAEIVVKNSVFYGTVDHAPDVEAAHAFVAELKARYADASHNASAFCISGGPQAVIGSSDDGEPGGTAGRPMLAVLQGSGLVQAVAVVTRYFGGQKLGTGGLVRAYGAAVREALNLLPTTELVLHQVARLRTDYHLLGKLQYLLPQYKVRTLDERYDQAVELEIAIPYPRRDAVAALLRELSNGQIELQTQETSYLSTEG